MGIVVAIKVPNVVTSDARRISNILHGQLVLQQNDNQQEADQSKDDHEEACAKPSEPALPLADVSVFPDDVSRLGRLLDVDLLIEDVYLHFLALFNGKVVCILMMECAVENFWRHQEIQVLVFVLSHLFLDFADLLKVAFTKRHGALF